MHKRVMILGEVLGMRILSIRNVSFEGSGVIEGWARNRGYTFEEIRSYEVSSLPATATFDFLLIMGGPQTLSEIHKYDYLQRVVGLIQEATALNKHILGICLGAQLISHAFGAVVEKSPEREVGVYPITLTEAGLADPLFKGFPQTFDVTHWHGDMAGLPPGAQVLAASAGCPRQIIKYTNRIYGLQCHMEMTTHSLQTMLRFCPEDLISGGPYIQAQEQLEIANLSSVNENMKRILDCFIEQ